MKISTLINNGGIGVVPTDTLYGLVGSAFSEAAVEKIYRVKKRNLKKPFIIIIGAMADLELFGIKLSEGEDAILKNIWPGKVSVILPCHLKKFTYLHRGTKSLAFRLPKKQKLINLIKETGPLAAPSANPEKFPPAESIKEAKKYFGDKVDFYINRGKIKSQPSTLVEIKNGELIIKRQGAVKIKSALAHKKITL
mgnify:CR=1 FL=1